MSSRERIKAYGAWIAVCLIWGTTYLAIRIAVVSIPDAFLAGVRFALAGALMGLILWIRGEKFPPLAQWGHLLVLGILFIGVGNWGVVWAEKFVPSGPAALIVATTPFWIAALEPFLASRFSGVPLVHKNTTSKLIGLFIGFAGVALLLMPDLQTFSQSYLVGILALQLASAGWALATIYSKYKKLDSGPLVNASLQMFLGGLVMTGVAAIRDDFGHLRWETNGVLAFLYLLIFGSMIGFLCFIYALSRLPSSVVSLYSYINPVIAVWLGWLILDEQVGWHTITATTVILTGVWLVKRDPVEKAEPMASELQVRTN